MDYNLQIGQVPGVAKMVTGYSTWISEQYKKTSWIYTSQQTPAIL